MKERKLEFLEKQSRRRKAILKAIRDIDAEELELYTNNPVIKRYVTIQQLRDHHRTQLRDIGHSIEEVVGSWTREDDEDEQKQD